MGIKKHPSIVLGSKEAPFLLLPNSHQEDGRKKTELQGGRKETSARWQRSGGERIALTNGVALALEAFLSPFHACPFLHHNGGLAPLSCLPFVGFDMGSPTSLIMPPVECCFSSWYGDLTIHTNVHPDARILVGWQESQRWCKFITYRNLFTKET